MNVVHHWFRSGSYSLSAHIHLPTNGGGPLGALIIPPFGWEDVCSHRSLRILGETLAANGIPAMRFDLPGTGDSSGDPQDEGLVEAWLLSVSDAATELRRATGVRGVSAVGIRLGAMLALVSASRGCDLQDLVLWGPAVTGRAVIRELRAFQQMAEAAPGGDTGVSPQPMPGLEVAGFLITPETQSDLEALDLSALSPGKGQRILVLTRDQLPADDKLNRALTSSGHEIEVRPGAGYAAMLAEPHLAIAPREMFGVIVDFLASGAHEEPQPQQSAGVSATVLRKSNANQPAVTDIANAGSKVRETMLSIKHSGVSLFGALCEPAEAAPSTGLCLLFLNPGAIRHIGPNRMWVEAARRWAKQGVPSLRLDFEGIGESDGDAIPHLGGLYQGNVMDEVGTAMESLRARVGARRFGAIGLCSGAFWAFHAATRYPEICASILLNPRLFFWDPEVDHRRFLRKAIAEAGKSTAWHRLIRGQVKTKRIRQAAEAVFHRFRDTRTTGGRRLQIAPSEMAQALASIQRNRSRLTLIFADDEPLLREMEEESWLPDESNTWFQCIRVFGGGHTFRPLWAQEAVQELIDREVESALGEDSLPMRDECSNLASKLTS